MASQSFKGLAETTRSLHSHTMQETFSLQLSGEKDMPWLSLQRQTHPALTVLALVSLVGLWLGSSCASEPKVKPSLESIFPQEGFENSTTKLTIRGQFPNPIEKLELVGTEQKKITLQRVTKTNETTLTAVVPSRSPPGKYDLKVYMGLAEPLLLGGAFELRPYALQIYIIDVGQGDATLIRSPTGRTMLIDAGTSAKTTEINRLLREIKVGQLDHILATHYDQDHVEGFANVVKGPDGKLGTADDHTPRIAIWDRGGSVKNKPYREIREELRKRYPKIHKPLSGETLESFPTIDLGGGVKVKIMTVNGKVFGKDGKIHKVDCKQDENCRSIGTLLTFGTFRFWSGGDLTGGGINTPDIESVIAEHIDPVDVYRVHHHGSRTGSSSKFIKAIKPQVAVLSLGKQNRYCHPHTQSIRNISQYAKSTFLLTTLGLLGGSAPCSKSPNTRTYIGSLGSKAFVNLGTFYLEVQETEFTVKGRKAPPNQVWKSR